MVAGQTKGRKLFIDKDLWRRAFVGKQWSQFFKLFPFIVGERVIAGDDETTADRAANLV